MNRSDTLSPSSNLPLTAHRADYARKVAGASLGSMDRPTIRLGNFSGAGATVIEMTVMI